MRHYSNRTWTTLFLKKIIIIMVLCFSFHASAVKLSDIRKALEEAVTHGDKAEKVLEKKLRTLGLFGDREDQLSVEETQEMLEAYRNDEPWVSILPPPLQEKIVQDILRPKRPQRKVIPGSTNKTSSFLPFKKRDPYDR